MSDSLGYSLRNPLRLARNVVNGIMARGSAVEIVHLAAVSLLGEENTPCGKLGTCICNSCVDRAKMVLLTFLVESTRLELEGFPVIDNIIDNINGGYVGPRPVQPWEPYDVIRPRDPYNTTTLHAEQMQRLAESSPCVTPRVPGTAGERSPVEATVQHAPLDGTDATSDEDSA